MEYAYFISNIINLNMIPVGVFLLLLPLCLTCLKTFKYLLMKNFFMSMKRCKNVSYKYNIVLKQIYCEIKTNVLADVKRLLSFYF